MSLFRGRLEGPSAIDSGENDLLVPKGCDEFQPAKPADLDTCQKAGQIPVMQTTLRLDDDLYRQAKARAAALGMSLTKFLEEAIRERLHSPAPAPRRQHLQLPVSSATGGLVPGFSTLQEAITAADLNDDRLVQARKRREIVDWVGRVDYYDDYDPKQLRHRKS